MNSQSKDYKKYISSDEWRRIREEFLTCELFEGFCAACGNTPDSFHIHHMTYARLKNEKLEDLIALCGSCHDSLHQFHQDSGKNLYAASQQFIKLSRTEAKLPQYVFDPFQRPKNRP
jgi:hypothetical protein